MERNGERPMCPSGGHRAGGLLGAARSARSPLEFPKEGDAAPRHPGYQRVTAAGDGPITGPDSSPPANRPPRLQATVDRWKSQLLDLSGKNRMLYYRETLQTLTLQVSEQSAWIDLVDGDGIPVTESTLVSLKDRAASGRSEAREVGERKLRRLSEVNRTFVEEQGVHVLHACFGCLTWPDDTRSPGPSDDVVVLGNGHKARLVRSPLIFVPTAIH